MPSKLQVALVCLSPHLEPAAIEQAIGVPASRTWKRGERIGRGTQVRQQNAWILDSDLPSSAALADHVGAILARCSGAALRSAAALGCELELAGVIYFRREAPVLSLTHQQLLVLGECKINLDLDLLPE